MNNKGLSYAELLCLIVVGFFLVGIFASCYHDATCKKVSKTISNVGGCDKYGSCGVIYSDGSSGKVNYPVKGQKVPVCVQ